MLHCAQVTWCRATCAAQGVQLLASSHLLHSPPAGSTAHSHPHAHPHPSLYPCPQDEYYTMLFWVSPVVMGDHRNFKEEFLDKIEQGACGVPSPE